MKSTIKISSSASCNSHSSSSNPNVTETGVFSSRTQPTIENFEAGDKPQKDAPGNGISRHRHHIGSNAEETDCATLSHMNICETEKRQLQHYWLSRQVSAGSRTNDASSSSAVCAPNIPRGSYAEGDIHAAANSSSVCAPNIPRGSYAEGDVQAAASSSSVCAPNMLRGSYAELDVQAAASSSAVFPKCETAGQLESDMAIGTASHSLLSKISRTSRTHLIGQAKSSQACQTKSTAAILGRIRDLFVGRTNVCTDLKSKTQPGEAISETNRQARRNTTMGMNGGNEKEVHPANASVNAKTNATNVELESEGQVVTVELSENVGQDREEVSLAPVRGWLLGKLKKISSSALLKRFMAVTNDAEDEIQSLSVSPTNQQIQSLDMSLPNQQSQSSDMSLPIQQSQSLDMSPTNQQSQSLDMSPTNQQTQSLSYTNQVENQSPVIFSVEEQRRSDIPTEATDQANMTSAVHTSPAVLSVTSITTDNSCSDDVHQASNELTDQSCVTSIKQIKRERKKARKARKKERLQTMFKQMEDLKLAKEEVDQFLHCLMNSSSVGSYETSGTSFPTDVAHDIEAQLGMSSSGTSFDPTEEARLNINAYGKMLMQETTAVEASNVAKSNNEVDAMQVGNTSSATAVVSVENQAQEQAPCHPMMSIPESEPILTIPQTPPRVQNGMDQADSEPVDKSECDATVPPGTKRKDKKKRWTNQQKKEAKEARRLEELKKAAMGRPISSDESSQTNSNSVAMSVDIPGPSIAQVDITPSSSQVQNNGSPTSSYAQPDATPLPYAQPDALPLPLCSQPDSRPLPYAQGDVMPLPYAQADVMPLPYAQADVMPLPYAQADVMPLPYAQADVMPLSYAQRDATPLPYAQADVMQLLYAQSDATPLPYAQADVMQLPYAQSDATTLPLCSQTDAIPSFLPDQIDVLPLPMHDQNDMPTNPRPGNFYAKFKAMNPKAFIKSIVSKRKVSQTQAEATNKDFVSEDSKTASQETADNGLTIKHDAEAKDNPHSKTEAKTDGESSSIPSALFSKLKSMDPGAFVKTIRTSLDELHSAQKPKDEILQRTENVPEDRRVQQIEIAFGDQVILELDVTTVFESGVRTVFEPYVRPVLGTDVRPVLEPDGRTVLEPDIRTISQPYGRTVLEPDGRTVLEPDGRTISQPDARTISEPDVRTISQPDARTISEPDVRTISQPDVRTISQPDVRTISQPDVRTISQPDGRTVLEPDVRTVLEPDGRTISQPDARTISQPDVRTISQPDGRTVLEPDVRTISQPDVRTISQPDVRTISQPDVRTISQPNVRTISVPDVRADPMSDPWPNKDYNKPQLLQTGAKNKTDFGTQISAEDMTELESDDRVRDMVMMVEKLLQSTSDEETVAADLQVPVKCTGKKARRKRNWDRKREKRKHAVKEGESDGCEEIGQRGNEDNGDNEVKSNEIHQIL